MANLLDPVTDDQRKLLTLMEESHRENQVWPTWQYVEQSMDLEGLDALAVLTSLPQLGQKHGIYGLTYGLTWGRGTVGGVVYQPSDPVGLTVLGFHQLGVTSIVETFLAVLSFASSKLATFRPDPTRVVTLEMTSEEVFAELVGRGLEPIPNPKALYELLEHEPAMWTGGRSQNQDGSWRWEVSRSIRPYSNVRTIEDYLAVVTEAAEESVRQTAQLVPLASPTPYLSADPKEQLRAVAGVDAASFSPHVPLLGSAVDDELWEFVRPLVEAGRWEQVAREAAAFVETRAKEWTGSQNDVLDLMSDLLKPPAVRSGDRDQTSRRNEDEGWHLMARGFFQAIRNHVMHNSVGTEEVLQYGMGALGTASLLVGRIRVAVAERKFDPATDEET